MANVRVVWQLPTQRVDGKALPVSAIDATIVSLSADGGANFVEIARVTAPTNSFRQTELEPGTYIFRLTVVDKQITAKTSSNVDTPVTLAAAAPNPVSDVSVVIE